MKCLEYWRSSSRLKVKELVLGNFWNQEETVWERWSLELREAEMWRLKGIFVKAREKSSGLEVQ